MFDHDVTVMDVTVVHDTFTEQRTIEIVGGLVPIAAGEVLSPSSLAKVHQVLNRHIVSSMAMIAHMGQVRQAEHMFAQLPYEEQEDDEEPNGLNS